MEVIVVIFLGHGDNSLAGAREVKERVFWGQVTIPNQNKLKSIHYVVVFFININGLYL